MGTLLMGMFSSAVYAASGQAQLTLQQAIQQTRQYQQSQELWQTRQQIAEANIKQSRLWVNPALSVAQKGFASDQEKELSIAISQPLDVFGQRKANQQLARIAQSQTDLKQKIYQAQL